MNLVRHFLTVGTNTMASRVLGFVREMLIAATLGAGPVADAFFAAFRFPNLFRRLLAEGAFNTAFIPLFARALEEEGKQGARQFASNVLGVLFAVLLTLTALVELAAPFFVSTLIAPGFADDPEKFALTVVLSRIMFPYLACMSLMAMISGMLNALHRYFAAAFAPVLLNIILIGVLWAALASGVSGPVAGRWMAWGVFAAGLAQLLLVAVALRKAGFALRPARPRMTPKMRRLLLLAAPAALAGGITQINLFIGQIIASQKAGAIATLQYADRIYQLPLGVVGIAVGVVLLPELSRALKGKRFAEGMRLQNRALEFALFLTVPAAAAIIVMPEPIVRVLFERGAFDADTTVSTARALLFFAAGLPAFVLVKVFSPGFFAREDTKTPMKVAFATMATNVALSLALFPVLQEAGIAIATSVAGWVNAGTLAVLLVARRQWTFEAETLRRAALIAVSAAIMAAVLWTARIWLDPVFASEGAFPVQVMALAGLVAAGAAVYFIAVQASGAARISDLRRLMRRPE